jgi:glycosyltransferase involved in cell wall biosynthesis
MSSTDVPIIAVVVPCFNEEAIFPHTLKALRGEISRLSENKEISASSYILFVDDGSRDKTWTLIESASEMFPEQVRGLKLARNAGHQNALLAGLLTQLGKVDAMISIDADLQDDIAVFSKMVAHFRDGGADIVFGVRNARNADTIFKRETAGFYYRFLSWLGADVIPHHADFRLMSDRAVRALSEFGESHVFLRGLVVQLGFTTEIVEFERLPRLHGETKYNLSKMAGLAIDGITSMSVRPIRIIAVLGLVLFGIFIGVGAWVFTTWMSGETVQGWTSLMLLFLLISSFQICALAVIGEYVGKIFFEAKSRPRYIIDRECNALPRERRVATP